jgi:hypothetical protein
MIAVGEGVAVPMRFRFDELDEKFRPKNGTLPVSAAWQEDTTTSTFIAETVERWRKQVRE